MEILVVVGETARGQDHRFRVHLDVVPVELLRVHPVHGTVAAFD